MDTSPHLHQKVAQTVWYIFMFICVIHERSLTFVCSEDISNIPLNLYQTQLLDPVDVSPNIPEEIISGDSYKRGTAFYGLRGKKLSDNFETSKDEQDKRGSFYPPRGKKPSAFTALRGKKVPELDSTDNSISSREENKDFVGDNNNSSSHENFKGSKSPWNTNGDAWKKLIQTGKYDSEPADNFIENMFDDNIDKKELGENSLEKRLNAEFFPMRGRKSYSEDQQFANEKRLNSFIPMRGRKSEEDEASNDDLSLDKKSVGFMPMRGRRSIFMRNRDIASRSKWPKYNSGKRVSFHAVRGKKNYYEWNSPKRAFYALRGKRLYDSDNMSNHIDLSNEDSNSMEIYRYRRSLQEKTPSEESKNTL